MAGTVNNWTPIKVNIFWNEVAKQVPVFQLYENEDKFLDILAGFVGTGINANDCAVVIASSKHLEKLKRKLELHGLHINHLIEDERYIPVPAEKILPTLMVNGLPDENLFLRCISEIVQNAKKRNRQIRAYREMSAILLAQGNYDGTVKLELLWNKYSQKERFSLFCAYPKSFLQKDECELLKEIHVRSSKIITNTNSSFEILYKDC
ncbi:MAG TPA: MEDS domain-containing protein [Flavipsychrobacter sp.]|nr:MEDS domain-containing protein [Flavipsychrobacter sp.]